MANLTLPQVQRLLTPRPGDIFERKQGNTYIPAHEVKAELTRIFGPGNWDHTIHDVTLVYETQITDGHPQFPKNPRSPVYYVACYRVACTLNIRTFEGEHIASTTEYHSEENAPLPNRGEAHAMALTSAQSYALRRAALDFGDAFGLHLYNGGNTAPLIRGSLVVTEHFGTPPQTSPQEQAAHDEVAASFKQAEQG